MKGEGFLLVHEDGEKRVDRLKSFLDRQGETVRELRSGRKNALDLGREEFFALSSSGVKPIVAGYGDGAVLALAIAQRCPVGGLICVGASDRPKNFAERRLSRSVSRDLFLIVAPTVLGVSPNPSPLERRLAGQVSPETISVIEADEEELWSEKALYAILKQLHYIRDTKALVLRQILRL